MVGTPCAPFPSYARGPEKVTPFDTLPLDRWRLGWYTVGDYREMFKLGFIGVSETEPPPSPHPPPAAGAGRHLPPKGKAFRGNPPLTYTRTFVFLCSIKQRTVSSGSLPPRGKVSPSKCGGRRMRGRQGYAIKLPNKPKFETQLCFILLLRMTDCHTGSPKNMIKCHISPKEVGS